MKHHQIMKRSTITAQLVLELIGVRCLTIPPSRLQLYSLDSGDSSRWRPISIRSREGAPVPSITPPVTIHLPLPKLFAEIDMHRLIKPIRKDDKFAQRHYCKAFYAGCRSPWHHPLMCYTDGISIVLFGEFTVPIFIMSSSCSLVSGGG